MTFDAQALQPLFLIIAALGLCISLCTEQSQIVAKTRGAFAGHIATGYMSAMRIMIFNRAGTILYMFFIALCIDTGITNHTLLLIAIASSIGVMGYNIFLVFNRAQVLSYTADMGGEKIVNILFARDRLQTFASFIATFCNILGLTLPFLLSNSFPEYRLTMANTGFLLNVIFTLINVMILETRYAYLLDHDTKASTYFFVVKIFIARTFATLCAIIVFTSFIIWFGVPA